jgi:hypothetical protein
MTWATPQMLSVASFEQRPSAYNKTRLGHGPNGAKIEGMQLMRKKSVSYHKSRAMCPILSETESTLPLNDREGE